MEKAQRISNSCFIFTIDASIFSKSAITKVLYWYAGLFNIFWKQENGVHIVEFVYKNKNDCPYTFVEIENKLNQDLIDYQNREIIEKETKNIRDILYIKAFANNDDFDDKTLA